MRIAADRVGSPQMSQGENRGSAPCSTGPRCPECGAAFVRTKPLQMFCSPEHRRVYARLWEYRGGVLAPLYATARATRGGSRGDKETGARARRDAEHLAQRWQDEDEAAGRMPVTAYVATRYRLGLVEVA